MYHRFVLCIQTSCVDRECHYGVFDRVRCVLIGCVIESVHSDIKGVHSDELFDRVFKKVCWSGDNRVVDKVRCVLIWCVIEGLYSHNICDGMCQ